MAEEAQVVEQTIADETVLKKYKEAGEITNSWVEKQKVHYKLYHKRFGEHTKNSRGSERCAALLSGQFECWLIHGVYNVVSLDKNKSFIYCMSMAESVNSPLLFRLFDLIL